MFSLQQEMAFTDIYNHKNCATEDQYSKREKT